MTHLVTPSGPKCGARSWGFSRMPLDMTAFEEKVDCRRCLGTVVRRRTEPTTAAKAATNIRTALKAKFPMTKFSVHSENFAGGNSVSVHWNLGPTSEAVDSIADRFQDGDFDGMTDSYNYRDESHVISPSGTVERVARAKYVQCSRSYKLPDGSDAFDLAKAWVFEHYAGIEEYETNRIAHTMLAKSDLSGGFHGFRRAPESNLDPYEAY